MRTGSGSATTASRDRLAAPLAEDAALTVVVIQLGAEHGVRPARPDVEQGLERSPGGRPEGTHGPSISEPPGTPRRVEAFQRSRTGSDPVSMGTPSGGPVSAENELHGPSHDGEAPGVHSANFRFPEGFLWGAATSSHQVEGNCTGGPGRRPARCASPRAQHATTTIPRPIRAGGGTLCDAEAHGA